MNLLQRFRLSRDRSVTVANLVDELLRRYGDREVSVAESGARRLAGVHGEICAMDDFLRHAVGMRPGQLVAIYRTNDVRCFHWFLAIVRAGGIAVPLNPMLTTAEVRRILSTSGAEILVTDKAVFERSIQSREAFDVRTWIEDDEETETLDGFLRAPRHQMQGHQMRAGEAPRPVDIDPSATIAIFHTSGTSGFPKGAALSSRALLGGRSSTVLVGLFVGEKDLALVALPWSHIMAVSIALYGLMAGTRGCFLERFDVASALNLVERLGVTTVVGVPAMFTRLVNSNPDPARLKTVRVWLSASDHLPLEVRKRLREFGALVRLGGKRLVPPVLINGYGMVELGGLAMMGVELSFVSGSGDLCFPVPPFKIRVADENGRPLRAGETGECQIRQRGLSPHYWKDQGEEESNGHHADNGLLTADGWLRTGDLAVRNRLGMIRLVGRMKEVIKSGGYSVYVRELEEAILAHPAVARTAAFGMDHGEKGEIPVAVVELQPGAEIDESELLDWCRKNLAAYKAPRRIWILEAGGIPLNHTGKVLRRVLRERLSAGPV
jgi:long-chain acyl-CoA synthetase